jgi:15-cis-phytoene synthase
MPKETPGPELRAAYAACRRMQRRHDPTYYWATRRLPREVRPAVHALYGFVRGADELVDGARRSEAPAERRAALDAWELELERGLQSGRSDHPVIAALVDAGRRHDLPLEELHVYMASMRMDCDRVRIETREELDRYMRGSAGAVGLIMAPLLGVPPGWHESFARLGAAFQLTNFVRDVREDYALDRLYLPREELERFGACEEEIAGGRATGAFRAALAAQVARARRLFTETAPAVAVAPAGIRPGMHLARSVYLRTLSRIEAIGFDVLARRPGLPPWEVGLAAVNSLAGRS